MVHYTFGITHANLQYIQISIRFETKDATTFLHLPSWRPGRYELGNFAKNVKGLAVTNAKGQKIEFSKLTKDSWQIDTTNTNEINVSYSYYAVELNAGSTFLNDEQLYVNPVNCCMFTEEQKNQAVQLKLEIPEDWKIACQLKFEEGHLVADNFDQLADAPFIASKSLQHASYFCGDIEFHIWVQGTIQMDWERVKKDFLAFSLKQIEKFGEFPVDAYHFILHILPYKAYHGVEHCASTVICLGPSHEVFKSLYKELLGVSSHELYHTWNVKAIRPIEMQPYDFTKENYSKLGYLCEGVTTYMGDLFLLKSKVFTIDQYLLEFNNQLQKHFDNPARFNYSVADSSFDTWLDGYVQGAPGRKVSIYTEGCLLAFVCDIMLLKATANKTSLDDVMRLLYFDYAVKGIGVSEQDYKNELEKFSGESMDEFYSNFINGTNPYEGIISDALDYIGLELIHVPAKSYALGRLGFKYAQNGSNFMVMQMFPGGPAELAGLMLNDEIIAVNNFACQGELDGWLQQFDDVEKSVTLIRAGKLLTLKFPEVTRNFYSSYSVKPLEAMNKPQRNAFEAWMR